MTCLAKAWSAYNKVSLICKSDLALPVKIHFFRRAAERNSSLWFRKLDLNVRNIQEIRWSLYKIPQVNFEHQLARSYDKEFFGNLLKLTSSIGMSLALHCWRKKELAHNLVFWEPSHVNFRKGRPAKTFMKQVEEDTAVDRCSYKADGRPY